MDTLEMREVEAAIEGILFASGEPVHVERICVAMNMDRATVELVLQKLADYYSFERRGIRLVRMDDTWQLCSAPEYGDIIVACKDSFRDGEPIIKRVIATEGQTVDIDFDNGIVYVDGVALEEEYIYSPTNLAEGMEFPLVVREGCLFLMGDNRMDSRDSRAPEIGQVDEREILGRAFFLAMPGTGRGEYTVEWDPGRIGGLN